MYICTSTQALNLHVQSWFFFFFVEFFQMQKYLNLKFKQTSLQAVAFPKKLFYFEFIEYEGKYKYRILCSF